MKDFFKLKQEIDDSSSITEKYKNTELKASPKPRDAHKANPSDSIRDQEVEKDKEVKKAKKPSDNYSTSEEKLDPVDKKALKKDFDDRKDKDIDNDGDVDASDEYLHNRRKTIGKAMRKDKKEEQVTKEDLEKEPDDPCWEGYVQVGTKMVDGNEVPNCVPMEEARNRMKNLNVTESKAMELGKKAFKSGKPRAPQSNEKDLEKIGGMTKKNMRDFIRGYDAESLKESKSKSVNEAYDAPDYGSAGASDMAITQMYFIKYAALEVIECLKAGVVMPEWYQNKIAKLEGDMEGVHSYMEGKKMRMKHAEHDRMKSRYMPGMGMGHGMYEEKQVIEEKAESEAQQKAAAIALAVKRGDQPESVLQGASRDMYDSMTADELEDFAKTKHSDIPAKKD